VPGGRPLVAAFCARGPRVPVLARLDQA